MELFTMLGKLFIIVVVGVMALSAIIMTLQNGVKAYQSWKETKNMTMKKDARYYAGAVVCTTLTMALLSYIALEVVKSMS